MNQELLVIAREEVRHPMIEPIARIRIELRSVEPHVWWRAAVPLSCTLLALHDIIQIAMGWTDSHLFEFQVGDRLYGALDLDPELEPGQYEASRIRLRTLIERGVRRFDYIYDFGDYWQHDVVIEGVRDGEADIDYPVFIDGERRCPSEYVGSAEGFMEFPEAALIPGHSATVRCPRSRVVGQEARADAMPAPDGRTVSVAHASRRRLPSGIPCTHELLRKELFEFLPIAVIDDDEAFDLRMRIQILCHFSRPVVRGAFALAGLVGDVAMKVVNAEVRLEHFDGLSRAPIRADHDLGAKVLAQCSQPFDDISVPVMIDRSEVVLVEVEIRRIVEVVSQTPAQLLQIMLETLLARRTLKDAVDVQEDHRTAACFVLHFE